MKKTIIPSLILVAALALLLMTFLGNRDKEPGQEPGPDFWDYRIIAHAMGGIHGHTYTNSAEAFIANYEQGSRIFETDLLLTGDDKLVARHEWTSSMSKQLGQLEVLPASKQGTALSYEEFMDSPILGLYTPLSWESILDLMQHYPDAYIVTDMKEFDSGLIMKEFQMLADAAKLRDPALLERIVPQIYSRSMLGELNRIYPFSHVIYTLYESRDSDEQVIDFAEENEVDITMPVKRATKKLVQALKRAGAHVYVHTENDEKELKKLLKIGVDGFYSDFISEDNMKAIS